MTSKLERRFNGVETREENVRDYTSYFGHQTNLSSFGIVVKGIINKFILTLVCPRSFKKHPAHRTYVQ